MILDKKTMRFIRKYKSKYIGSIIMIALSCMMFIGFNIASPNINTSIDNFRKDTLSENVNFSVSQQLSEDDIKDLEKQFSCQIESRSKIEYTFDGDTIEIYTPTTKVDKYQVIDGDNIKNEYDILLDKNYAKANNYNIGDTIDIKDNKFKVCGYYAEADHIYIIKPENEIMPNPKKLGIAIISDKDYKNVFSSDGIVFYSALVNENDLKNIKNTINEKYILFSWNLSEDNIRMNFIDGEMNAFSKVGYIVPIFILIITSVMISIVSVRQIKMEYGIIGTLTALGYRKKEITNHYMRYSLFQCIAGSLLGLLPGVVFALIIGTIFLQKYSVVPIEPKLESLWIIPVGLILPFIFVIPSAYITLRKALDLKPIELMGHATKSKKNTKNLYKRINLSSFKFKNKFRIRDTIKNIPRTLLLIFGITFSSILLLFGFTTIDSINNVVNDNYENVYKYEYQYNFKSLQFESDSDDDKINYSIHTIKSGSKIENNITIYGVEPDNNTIVFEQIKADDMPFENNIITSTLAKKLNVSEGDTLTVTNKYSEDQFDIKIDKIVKTNVGDNIFIPLSDFNKKMGYTENSYIQILSKNKLDIESDLLLSWTDKETQKDNFNQLVSTIKMLVIAIWVVSIIISIIIINTVSTMLIEENRINISLLKVLGYHLKEINGLTLRGNIFMVVIGYAISVPAIIKIIDLLFSVLMSKMNVTISASLNLPSILIGFVMIVLCFEISLYMSKKKIMNISMSDALKMTL